jgi:hypothetical protein
VSLAGEKVILVVASWRAILTVLQSTVVTRKKRAYLSWFRKSTSIVAETIDARKRGIFPVDSRAKIFDGPAIGI